MTLLAFTDDGWEDYLHWQQTDRKVLARINDLIRDTLRHPQEGIGKPERLKGALSGYWSRRITQEHRLVYKVLRTEKNQTLIVHQCRYHY
ncbi:Txe/YoeB family addiction module toxin [Rhizobium halophytocola]|uniref:Txe/YoeB family addiction module toxin n=1 Tax=Rhizobium halophytocola TaxID=735519 RepID=UPI001AE224C5